MKDFLSERKEMLAKLSKAYYEGEPLVTDEVFDSLQKEYQEAGGEEIVGHGFTVSNNKITHDRTMGSLKKIKNDHEKLIDWVESCKNIHSENNISTPLHFSVSPKFDGLAAVVKINNGNILHVATRGDGKIGENITTTAIKIPTIVSITDDGYHYGEILLPKENFKRANSLRGAGSLPFNTLRNAAVGIVRTLDDDSNTASTLVFANHENGHYISYYSCDELISNINDILSTYENYHGEFPFTENENVLIDGVVFKVENDEVRNIMGESSGSPKWARAFKFADEIHMSHIVNVDWGNPGKTGRLTPVFEYETIVIDGGKYNRATGHNITQFETFGASVGDEIYISKSNDVIPYVVDVRKTSNEEKILIPERCPICNASTVVKGEFLYCSNRRESCNPVDMIVRIFSSFEIKGIQSKTIAKIKENFFGDVNNPFEILLEMKNLPAGSISSIEGLGEKMENKIRETMHSIWNNKNFAQWVLALNIPNIGNSIAEELSIVYGSFESIVEAIDDSTKMKQNSLLKGVNWDIISSNRNKFVSLDKWIVNNGIDIVYPIISNSADSFWNNKKVAITGKMSVPRKEIEVWLKSNGAKISSSFEILIFGDGDNSSKMKKAKANNIEMMSEKQFIDVYFH